MKVIKGVKLIDGTGEEPIDDLTIVINEDKIDILIGTQMISKGFNFPKLNCIVAVSYTHLTLPTIYSV